MTWCNNDQEESDEEERRIIGINNNETIITPLSSNNNADDPSKPNTEIPTITCPSCGHNIQLPHQGGLINELPGLPAGVKFDPNDQEILEHLEAKVVSDVCKLHPLIDEFIPTLQGHNGICYTHPERLPGVSKDGQIRHFFHRPSKAYTTGTRKRRKVDTDNEGSETRWHKTGKTRPVFAGGSVRGFKKILVLYTNYGRQRKPEKTNWVMHQYHLGSNEEEKDGELVVSKVFYQTQPRQCGSLINNVPHNNNKDIIINHDDDHQQHNQYDHQRRRLVNNDDDDGDDDDDVMMMMPKESGLNNVEYYNNSPYMSYDHNNIIHHRESSPPPQLIPNNLVVQGDHHHGSSFIRFAMDANKAKLQRKL